MRDPTNVTNTPIIVERLWGRGEPCPYDDLIDVRSPLEYAEDHIPGAINLPVLGDSERAEVGTVYRNVGAFEARKVGAAYVSVNIARHLREHFADKGKQYRPFLYCWRGGQRSASIAIVLAQVGWRVAVLRGGYQTYRRHVRDQLESLPNQFTYRLLAGATGTAKTRLLHALAARGAQTLDLESLARHRGSVLGHDGPQPSQKWFDSMLLAAFDRLDTATPVWIEAESNRIGNLFIPRALWRMMRESDGILVRMPIESRVRHLTTEYSHLLSDSESLKCKLRSLVKRRGHRQIADWERAIDAGLWTELVESLLTIHYDPAYAESARRCHPNVVQTVELASATPTAIDTLVDQLLE